MPKITPGNRLYLYQLLSRELGVGRQTSLARAEEALSADGLAPADLGCADMRELCEQLGEFVKLTVFKKGYVYVTVLACEEYDRALAHADEPKAPKDKPWKRRRGAKALRPVRPRHVEPAPETEEPAPAGEKDEAVAGTATADAEVAAETVAEVEPETADEPVAEAEPEATTDPEVTTESATATEPEAATETDPAAQPEPAATPEDEPEPEPAVQPDPTATPEPAAEPEPAHAPAIALTITYDPGSADDPQPDPAPVTAPEPAPAPTPERVQADLPQDFHRDVRCPSEQLSLLYQVLPPDVDPMATLEEDFRVARSTGALEGTRSNVSFSLRYLQPDGTTPVRVTLRRSARATGGKHWTLAGVEAGSPAEVGIEGLAEVEGPLARAERLLAGTVSLGSWDEATERLAESLAPDSWGPDRCVLRGYLALTFARVQAEGQLHVSEDGSRAWFDTGLLAVEGTRLVARLSAHPGDIPWQLDGFSAEP